MLYTVTLAEGIFPGVMQVFKELESLGLAKHIYVNQLNEVKPSDTAIFGAWHPNYSMPLRHCKSKKKYISWHSPMLQAELNNEPEFIQLILNLKDKDVISGIVYMDEDNYKIFGDENDFYLPHPFCFDRYKKYQNISAAGRKDIAFFTAFFNKQKNILCQLAAVSLLQKQNKSQSQPSFILHTNGMSETHKNLFAKYTDLMYHDHGYLPDNEYYQRISSVKLGLQVSVSEAFNYVAAIFLALGTPCLLSPTIACNFDMFIDENPVLRVVNIDSSIEIVDKIKYILEMDEEEYSTLSKDCVDMIEALSVTNNKKAKETIGKII